MYDWLIEALEDSATVVTANRRLARVLADDFAMQQLAAGKKAWRSPLIYFWQDWLDVLLSSVANQDGVATRINAHQSQLLWERCLRKELDDGEAGLTSLVRMARDTRQRLEDWQIPISEVARSAQNDDQKMFAVVAGRYQGLLEHEGWIDDAAVGSHVVALLNAGQIKHGPRFTFAGFERERPILSSIQQALRENGAKITQVPAAKAGRESALYAFTNSHAEQRAAGAWARQQLDTNPNARIAIIANGLESDADGISRRVREGVTPGWQYGHTSLFDAVNISYGQRLADFPAIHSALLVLRWLVEDLTSTEVGMLLRSQQLGSAMLGGRSRLELRLRQLPDRRWSPAMVTTQFRGRDDDDNQTSDTSDWMTRLAVLSKRRRELPKQASPSEWVLIIDDVLKAFNWPGEDALQSSEFQLINRWRELLNEFARLALVSAKFGPRAAIARIELMAGETVFQPESKTAAVQLMGALEASGACFDAIWISGVTTTNWPPAGTPSLLISRRLQQTHDMPDCSPDNTLHYAAKILQDLMDSASNVVCSYALTEDDVLQAPSDLVRHLQTENDPSFSDPGWHAATLTGYTETQAVEDRVPSITGDERLAGGAATIQRQITEPMSAFVHARMGARVIYPQAIGIPATMRGNLIHDALYKLYIDLPSSQDIGAWQASELSTRIADAVDFAVSRHEKNIDAVLQQLLILERARISDLLRAFVAIDSQRGEFSVASVEGKFEFVAGNVRLPLRFDRIDSFDDQSIAILDYKTGSKKSLLNRNNEVQDVQLFVYASATDVPVSALALVNVDSREVAFDGAGRGYTDVDAWPELLQAVKADIAAACTDLSKGDVRINIEQGAKSARPLNLLSRYTELRRDFG
jgi:probable DNA repair protein